MTTRALDALTWRALSRKLYQRGTAWPTLAVLTADGLLATGALLLMRSEAKLALPAAVLLLTLALLHSYLIQHECVHGAVFADDRLNRLLGNLLGFLLFLPFPVRRRAHLLHHAWTGHAERDPANRRAIARLTMLPPRAMRCCELLWRGWVPFLVINERVGLWLEALAPVWQRMRERPRKSGGPGGAAHAPRLWTLAYLAGYGVLLFASALPGAADFVLHLYMPALVLATVLEEAINLPHHAETPLVRHTLRIWEQAAVTHSCRSYPIWSGVALLRFNLHTAHHLFPKLPWYRLAEAQRLLASTMERGAHVSGRAGDADDPDLCHELCWNLQRRRRPFRDVFAAYFANAPDGQAAAEAPCSAHAGTARVASALSTPGEGTTTARRRRSLSSGRKK